MDDIGELNLSSEIALTVFIRTLSKPGALFTFVLRRIFFNVLGETKIKLSL